MAIVPTRKKVRDLVRGDQVKHSAYIYIVSDVLIVPAGNSLPERAWVYGSRIESPGRPKPSTEPGLVLGPVVPDMEVWLIPPAPQPEYLVTWRMHFDADSPEDAARKALAVHRDPESIATVFDVASEGTSVTVQVDLTPDA